MFQETYIFVATIFTFESFNFNILIFDQEIGLYKPFQFLWSLKSDCFKAHLQNLKTNTFIKSLYPKTTNFCLWKCEKSCLLNFFKTCEQKLNSNHSSGFNRLLDTNISPAPHSPKSQLTSLD